MSVKAAVQRDKGSAEAESAQVRARIQAAAEARFKRYGFTKTTLAEIGADCGMSAANIYRYFDCKGDIAAASAKQWLANLRQDMAAIVADSDFGAGERLHRMIRLKVKSLHGLIESDLHLKDLIEHVCREREALIEAHCARERALVAELIVDGMDRGEFRPLNVDTTAAAVIVATQIFSQHGQVRAAPIQELLAETDNVVALMVEGMLAR